jgi:hypothetical protein
MIVTTINDILQGICKKHNGGCKWEARRYIWFSHVKITRSKPGKPDKLEFRTRLINIQNKDPNVEFVKLKNPVMSTGHDWYIGEYKKSRKNKNKKSKKNKNKNKKSRKGGTKDSLLKQTLKKQLNLGKNPEIKPSSNLQITIQKRKKFSQKKSPSPLNPDSDVDKITGNFQKTTLDQ